MPTKKWYPCEDCDRLISWKLTKRDYAAIRAIASTKVFTYQQIADRFGISKGQVSKILKRGEKR